MADPEANLCHQNWIQIQNLLLQDSLHFHHQRWLVHHLHHVSLSGPSVPAWGQAGVIVPFPPHILAVNSSKYVGAKPAPSKAFEYYLLHPLEFQTFLWPYIRIKIPTLAVHISRSKVDLFMPSSLGSSWNSAKMVIWNVQVMFMLRYFISGLDENENNIDSGGNHDEKLRQIWAKKSCSPPQGTQSAATLKVDQRNVQRMTSEWVPK